MSREQFRALFIKRALKFGDFTLASGQKSSYYLNSKQVLFHPQSVTLLGELLADAVADIEFDAAGGLEVGAIPMTTALAIALHHRGRACEGFFVRKEAKGHGSQSRLEGVLRAGDRAVVLDDVLTTGASAAQAIEVVEAAGATVVRVISICDRLQGARERLSGYDYRSLYTIEELLPPGSGERSL